MSWAENNNPYEWQQRFWSVIIRRGVSPAPTALYEYQCELELTAQEVWFIMYILSFKWNDSLPYPSLEKMSKKSRISSPTLHSYKNSLIKKGYLEIVNRTNEYGWQTSNWYNFTKLFKKLEELIIRDDNGLNNDISEVNTPVLNYLRGGSKNSDETLLKNLIPSVKNINTNNKHWQEQNNKNKLTTSGDENLLLFWNINIKKDVRDKLVKTYTQEQISEIVKFIEAKIDDIDNPVWFLIDALKNWYELNSKEKDKKEKIDKRSEENKKIEQQELMKKELEDFKRKKVENWKAENPDEYLEIFEEEKKKLMNSTLLQKNDFIVEINTRIRIKKEILWLD